VYMRPYQLTFKKGFRSQTSVLCKRYTEAFELYLYYLCCADIVFLRSWYPLTVPQLYNPVTSLLLPVGQKGSWSGMRTLGQLKHDLGIRNKPNTDSLYKVE